MPAFCSVVGCGNRGERDLVSFYRFPAIIKNRGDIMEKLTTERRNNWVNALKRGPLSDTMLKNGRVCSKHFLSGKPADVMDNNNPDWLPSQQLGFEVGKQKNKDRIKNRKNKKELVTSKDSEDRELHPEIEFVNCESISDSCSTSASEDISSSDDLNFSADTNNQDFQCSVYNKIFSQNYNLKKHENSHRYQRFKMYNV